MNSFDPIAYINEPRWQESRLGLERIEELLNRMGRPQDRLKFVHVAGTNGKGSTCAYLASVFQEAGYVTGLFTSPFIIEFEERIRVNGKNISHDDLSDVTLFVRGYAESMAEETGEHPTEFELMTAVAFEHFARSGCDIVVCEVGLGGRLDSTNVIQLPEACVITCIGLDHTGVLGTTVREIACEKAGIIKRGVPVVTWPQGDDARDVISEACNKLGCSIRIPDFGRLQIGAIDGGKRKFAYRGLSLETSLLGSYQPYNASLAIEVLDAMRERGWKITDEDIARGVARTVWPGRFEVVDAGAPTVVVDGGHNPQGADVLAQSMRDAFPDKRVVFLMSVLADKDYRSMIRAVAPLADAWVCVTSPNAQRALSGENLAVAVGQEAKGSSATIIVASDFFQAMEKARFEAGPDGVVCAFGSLYSIESVMRAL